ncbi:complex I subunit 5 family protein [Litchfieldella xinjiangensis]|uniref:complex I subunit 5 family protein n=1 Tax=Litchfieldella xinjiangensis TaxID=1166948 RepID=UPI000AF3B6DD|nr:proton-conducting transporter membrane subunit [Halomonas xinjiangensis]
MVNLDTLILLTALLVSFVAAPLIFLIPEEQRTLRTLVNMVAAVVKLSLVMFMVWGVANGRDFALSFTVMETVSFRLRADALGLMFAGLSSLLWFCTTIYAVGYLEKSPNRKRFFGFFSLCVGSTLGIALSANLFTFLLFYELLTLSTYPLIVHRGTPQALKAGAIYLRYTLGGGVVLLVGMVSLQVLAGDVVFGEGQLDQMDAEHTPALIVTFALLVGGLGVKAALVPLHGWLPQAMVAPAPVSALLHAVAVVKAGAFGIVRVIYDVYGLGFAQQIGVLAGLAIIASFTIIYGSLRAMAQSDIKRLLAYSTVSQVSYIVLGIALFGPMGTIAAMSHLLHQGLMKSTLFFCAGNYAQELDIHRIEELDGVGWRMPVTSLAFTIGALGMIGIPPVAGFISKWYLGMAALESGMTWVIVVLMLSTILNAAYFLPVIYRLWFKPAPHDELDRWPEARLAGGLETSYWLMGPAIATAVFSLLAGMLAGVPFSPLQWATLIVNQEYVP